MVNGLGVFWPAAGGRGHVGRRHASSSDRSIRSEVNPDTGKSSIQFKTANREQDPQRQDFRWIKDDAIRAIDYPPDVLVLERVENGDFYGFVKGRCRPRRGAVV